MTDAPPSPAGLRIVQLDRRDEGWRVSHAWASGQPIGAGARHYRSAKAARDAARAMAAERGALIVFRDLRSSRAPAIGSIDD